MSGKNKWSDLKKKIFTTEQIDQIEKQAKKDMKGYSCKNCIHKYYNLCFRIDWPGSLLEDNNNNCTYFTKKPWWKFWSK